MHAVPTKVTHGDHPVITGRTLKYFVRIRKSGATADSLRNLYVQTEVNFAYSPMSEVVKGLRASHREYL